MMNPYSNAPELSPCGRYALFDARFGDSSVWDYMPKVSMWDAIALVRMSVEN